MDHIWTQIALVGALVLLNAGFAGSEIALLSLREGQLARLAERGRSGRTLARLAHDPNRFLATIQIGITLAGFLASATAAVTLAAPIIDLLQPLGAAARPTAIVLVTLILTFVTLVVGELAPKRVAMQRAERWGLAAAQPLAAIAFLAQPAIWILGRSTDLVVRLLGVDPARQRQTVSEEEIRDLVAAQPDFTDHQRDIIEGAFEFADRTLRQIMVPRPSVLAFPDDADCREVVSEMVSSGHSRAPVYRGDVDMTIGTVHLRALVDHTGPVGPLAQPALLLPESVGALDALRAMQTGRQQMAVVLNEHGATEGIVTIEDLVEELVGEIWDEADADVRGVEHHVDGSLTVDGAYPVHDLGDIGIDIPEGDYATVAGLVLERLGRIPEAGERLVLEGWDLVVLEATERAILRVRMSPHDEMDAEAPEDGRQDH